MSETHETTTHRLVLPADANHYAVDSYDGGYVVVYQDSSSKEIRFKRYDASGSAVGSETVVESVNQHAAQDYNGVHSQSYAVAGLEGVSKILRGFRLFTA